MTHRKPPGTTEFAIAKVVSALGGAEAVSDLLGVGRSTVDSWKNPGRTAKPSLDQVISMEVEYANITDEPSPTPIVAALLANIEGKRLHPPSMQLLDEVLRLRASVDDISSLVLTKSRIQKLGQPIDLSKDELAQIQSTLSEAMKIIAILDNSLRNSQASTPSLRAQVSYSLAPSQKPTREDRWWQYLRSKWKK